MRANSKPLSREERKALIERVISDCQKLAISYVKDWQPINSDWEIVEGCAYLRLSDEDQVLVEKGSLEQQINIAISEAINRSHNDEINYQITMFYIEPGITGTHDRRPQLQLMKKNIKLGRHGFVVIKEIARLIRDTLLWKELFRLCHQMECDLFIRGLPFNPNDPTQVLHLDFLAMLAEYESKQTSKRLKESVFAAIVTSGKFNSTHKVLGLDQLSINGDAKVGLYTPNKEELKTVEWIMQTFIRYQDYKKTCDECRTKGVLNKNGELFQKNSLKTLLTNSKYIGEWTVNEENKDKNPNKLMAYEKYEKIDLPHGCVIDRNLWDRVQAVVERIAGTRNTTKHFKRVYPLKGILQFKDGTTFAGNGAWGKTGRISYYWNKAHNIRIPADVIEKEVSKIVSEVIKRSPRLREGIKKWGAQVQTTAQLLNDQVGKIEGEIIRLKGEQEKIDKRLDFLLEDSSPEEAKKFQRKYREDSAGIEAEIGKCHEALHAIQTQRNDFESEGFDWKHLTERAEHIQEVVNENDPEALRVAYRKLFAAVIVGDIDKRGVRPLIFNLRGGAWDLEEGANGLPTPAGGEPVNLVEKNCIYEKLAQAEGLEPPTNWLTANCSTD